MKSFIKKLVALGLITATLTMTINFIYAKRREPNPYGIEHFATIPDKIQICNFGSSHGQAGFCYEDLENEYGCFNFALAQQSLSYDYRLFQYYCDRIDNGAVVFIPISYFSLFGTAESDIAGFASKNKRYYFILSPALVKEYDYQTDIFLKHFPALATDTNNLVKTLLKKTTSAGNGDGPETATDRDFKNNAKVSSYSHVGNARYYDKDGNRIKNQEEISALYDLIKACQKRGAVPILITMPFLHEYTDEIRKNTPDFYDHFHLLIDRIVRDTGVEFYDYAFDDRFTNERSWFYDSNHLNKVGARNFTGIVMQEIVYAKGYLDK